MTPKEIYLGLWKKGYSTKTPKNRTGIGNSLYMYLLIINTYFFRINATRKLLLEPETVPASEFKEILEWREELKQIGGKVTAPHQDMRPNVPTGERLGIAIPNTDVGPTVPVQQIHEKGITFDEQRNTRTSTGAQNRSNITMGQLPERSQLFVGRGGRSFIGRNSVTSTAGLPVTTQPKMSHNISTASQHVLSPVQNERYVPLTHSASDLHTLPNRLSHIDLNALQNNIPQNETNRILPGNELEGHPTFNEYMQYSMNSHPRDLTDFTISGVNRGPSLTIPIPSISPRNNHLSESPGVQNNTLSENMFELSPSFLQTLENTAPLKTTSTISQNMFPYEDLDNLDLSSVSEFSPDTPGPVLRKQTHPAQQDKPKEDFLELSKPNIQVNTLYPTYFLVI